MSNSGFPPPIPTRTPARIDYASKTQVADTPGTNGIRLFQLRGITVFLHWSWFIVAIYQIQSRRRDYTSILWNVAEYLTLFLIVLLHEFGHAFACRSVGGIAERIMLWPLGGVAYVSPPPRPGAMLWSIAAGPLVNVVLFFPLYVALERFSGNLGSYIDAIYTLNLWLLIFNLLPIYPLDGGQILQSILWFIIGRTWSLMVAASIGVACATLAVLFGIYSYARGSGFGILSLVLAAYIGMQAWAGLKFAMAMRRMDKIPRRSEFACPACGTSPPALPIWKCPQCDNSIDIFASGGACPNCGSRAAALPCTSCGQVSPFHLWARPGGPGASPVGSFTGNPNPAGFQYIDPVSSPTPER